MRYRAVAHHEGDDVAVAVEDLTAKQDVQVHFLDSESTLSIQTREAIPLGHKLALRDIQKGDKVVKYGEQIGSASSPISAGDHVHIHNLKSLRW